MSLQQVAEDVRALARMFKSVETLGLALGEIGNLEQYKVELESAIEKAKAALGGLNGEAEAVAAFVASEKGQAQAEASAIREKANEDANALVLRAIEESARRVEAADAKVAAAEESARKQVAYATEAQAMADQAREELGELEKRVEAAKAYLQNLAQVN